MVINIYSDVTMYYFRRLGIFRTYSIRNLQYPIDDYISKGVYILKVHALQTFEEICSKKYLLMTNPFSQTLFVV